MATAADMSIYNQLAIPYVPLQFCLDTLELAQHPFYAYPSIGKPMCHG